MASAQNGTLLCTETFVSDMCYMSQLLVPGISSLFLLCRGRMPWARKMAAYTCEIDMEHFANSSLSVFVAKLCILGFMV